MTTSTQAMPCIVCQTEMSLQVARGRKSGKPFLMMVCAVDGRHFRAFIADRDYVKSVVDRTIGSEP